MREYILIEKQEKGARVKTLDGREIELKSVVLPSFAVPGDRISWVEHSFYDVIDEKGNIIFRPSPPPSEH